jgi:RES domain-containing protein
MAVDPTRIATAPRARHPFVAYRNQAPQYDPRSGGGARLHGGRFNPPGSFPVLYLCETRPCVIAELTRQGKRNVVGVDGLLPRVLYQYRLELERVLDLTDPQVRDHLGFTVPELQADDWSVCQEIGIEAHAHGDQAIRAPSATGVDQVLAVFPEPVGTGLVGVELVEHWRSREDLRADDPPEEDRHGTQP